MSNGQSDQDTIAEWTHKLKQKDAEHKKLKNEIQFQIRNASDWEHKYNELLKTNQIIESKDEQMHISLDKKDTENQKLKKEIQFHISNASKFEEQCKQSKQNTKELLLCIQNQKHKIQSLTTELNNSSNENKRLQQELTHKKK
eukprot:227086_1